MIFKIIIKKDYICIWKKICFEEDEDICEEILVFCFKYNFYMKLFLSQHGDKALKLGYYFKFFFVSLSVVAKLYFGK